VANLTHFELYYHARLLQVFCNASIQMLLGKRFAIDNFPQLPLTRARIFRFHKICLPLCQIKCAKYAYMTDSFF